MGAFYGRAGVDFRNTMPDGVAKLKGVIRRNVLDAGLLSGELVRERAFELANVRTGLMRDNIEVHVVESPGQIEVRIGIDLSIVPYAPHQEFGPHGKPFLRPALDESRAEIHDMLQGAIDGTALEDSSTFVRFNRGKP